MARYIPSVALEAPSHFDSDIRQRRAILCRHRQATTSARLADQKMDLPAYRANRQANSYADDPDILSAEATVVPVWVGSVVRNIDKDIPRLK
ncbi:hypothetical protein PT974_12362 [Cladobotryum mycophilum]|uniref:Uncharacterized protein n=1 Tax=Cladobotryum mycophilum TaxID=491253 RepID=A0ABR0S7S9_9HYPO